MKLPGKKKPVAVPAWHPDFRDPETLPDVKVVRTSFFIYGACFLAFASILLVLIFQELNYNHLEDEIQAFEAQIAAHAADNERVLKLHAQFQAHQRYIDGVAKYLDDSLELSKLLVALAESLYPNMTLSSIRYEGNKPGSPASARQIHINGTIRATPDAAASIITQYLEVFSTDPFLQKEIGGAVLSSLVPSPEGDTMAFGIQLKIKAEPAAPKTEASK